MRISGTYPFGSYPSPTFDLRVLSLGAGVQSSCLLHMMADGEFGDEYPRHAVFADTHSEPAEVYAHLESLRGVAERAGVTLHTASAGDLGADILASTVNDTRFAAAPFFTRNEDDSIGMGRRQCTREYKIDPIARKIREILGVPRIRRGQLWVESWQGISYDEMQRMKEPRFPWQYSRYPLIERRMTRADCLRYMAERGHDEPPKSACVFCPFRDDAAWARMRDESPDDWREAVAFDHALRANGRALQFVHRTAVPLDKAELRVDDPDQLDLFQMECEGMCGV